MKGAYPEISAVSVIQLQCVGFHHAAQVGRPGDGDAVVLTRALLGDDARATRS